MKLEREQKIGTMPPKLIALIKEEARKIGYTEAVEDLNIDQALSWYKTSQGDDFWNKLYTGGEVPEEFLGEGEYSIY